jgi:hypothetical protein
MLEFWCVTLFLGLSLSTVVLIHGLDLLMEEKP